MGKISQGILGGVSGTIGSVVGGSWKGINYLRAKTAHFNDANSDLQIGHRAKFSACVLLAKIVMESIIKPIWSKKAVKMSGYNLFVKNNLQVFSENGEISDYGALKFSIGDLPLPSNIDIKDDAAVEGGILISWVDNSNIGISASTDRLRVLAMCNGEISILSGLNVTRSDQTANILLPFGPGIEANVYIFFENATNTKYSVDKHAMVAVS